MGERASVARASAIACAIALVVACGSVADARSPSRDVGAAPTTGGYSVTLEQCVGSGPQPERSATFVAQMDATQTTQRMSLQIDLEQRLRGEAGFHTVPAPGLGVWRSAEPGVKIYKYVKQITNLQAPAAYRVLVRFRWVGDRGRAIKRAETRSSRCWQPPQPATPAGPPA